MYSFFEWLVNTIKNVWSALSGLLGNFFTSVATFLNEFDAFVDEKIKAAWNFLGTLAIDALTSVVSGINAIIPDYRVMLPSLGSYRNYLTLAERFIPFGLAWTLLLAFLAFSLGYYTFKLVFRALT